MKRTKTKSRSETKARPAARDSGQNVPYRKPALRSEAFARATISEQGLAAAVEGAKTLALTTFALASDTSVRDAVQNEFAGKFN